MPWDSDSHSLLAFSSVIFFFLSPTSVASVAVGVEPSVALYSLYLDQFQNSEQSPSVAK